MYWLDWLRLKSLSRYVVIALIGLAHVKSLYPYQVDPIKVVQLDYLGTTMAEYVSISNFRLRIDNPNICYEFQLQTVNYSITPLSRTLRGPK